MQPKFQDATDFCRRVDEYFAECKEKGDPPNISDLAVYLGTNRETLSQYENGNAAKKELSEEIRGRIADRIKLAHEQIAGGLIRDGLKTNSNPALRIFLLKNHGYTDRQELHHVVEDEAGGALDRLEKARARRSKPAAREDSDAM